MYITYIEPALIDVRNDHPACAHGLRRQQVDESDGTGAADEDGGSESDSSAVARVDADGERLHERALLKAHVGRELVAEGGGVGVAAS